MSVSTAEAKIPGRDQGKTDASHLRTGEQYRTALRDGRKVWNGGKLIGDVTTHPSLGPGISMLSEMFDAQFDPELADITTYIDDEGVRSSRSWQLIRKPEDFVERRKLIEYTTLKTAGSFGRPPDLAPLIAVGLYARKPLFAKSGLNVDFADNIDRYIDHGRRSNVIAAEVLADPQA